MCSKHSLEVYSHWLIQPNAYKFGTIIQKFNAKLREQNVVWWKTVLKTLKICSSSGKDKIEENQDIGF